MTQPTEGLGQVLPSPRRASASAARMWAASSAGVGACRLGHGRTYVGLAE